MKLNNKGFGLIELIAVMTILSIITFFTVPNFSPYTSYSKEKELTQEIAKVEYEIKRIIIEENIKSWNIVEDNGIKRDLWTSNGKNLDVSGKLIEIPKEVLDTELSGSFYFMNGKIYYSEEILFSVPPNNLEDSEDNSGIEKVVDKSRLNYLINFTADLDSTKYISGWIALEKTIEAAILVNSDNKANQDKINRAVDKLEKALLQLKEYIPEDTSTSPSEPEWEMATDGDFIWVEEEGGYSISNSSKKGFFKYVGNKEYVIIPNTIHGYGMKNYRKMFIDNDLVKGVSSYNTKITSMAFMFFNSNLTELNLNNLVTSDVIYFTRMFANANIENHLNLSDWNIEKAIYMEDMFLNATIGTVNFNGFQLKKVSYMHNMFRNIKIDELDISSFDLEKVIYLGDMFTESHINKIYVKKSTNKK